MPLTLVELNKFPISNLSKSEHVLLILCTSSSVGSTIHAVSGDPSVTLNTIPSIIEENPETVQLKGNAF